MDFTKTRNPASKSSGAPRGLSRNPDLPRRDPPGTIIGPEGGWGLPHTFAKICILSKKGKTNRLGAPKPFFLEEYSLTFRRPEFPVPTDRVKEAVFWRVCGFLPLFVACCVLQNFVEVQRSVCACIGPGDSPAQLLYVFGDFNISDNSENDDEYFPNVRHNVGSLVFVSVCVL